MKTPQISITNEEHLTENKNDCYMLSILELFRHQRRFLDNISKARGSQKLIAMSDAEVMIVDHTSKLTNKRYNFRRLINA